MREIKFRAWDKQNHRICDVISIDFANKTVKLHYDNRADWEVIREIKDYTLSFELVELVRPTGLKDKNGKEIYEGYIVQTGVGGKLNSRIKRKAIVKWHKQTGQWRIDLPIGFIDICSTSLELNPFGLWQFEVEVIGNIYENPELLGETT